VVNKKIYELEYLKKNLRMESEVQTRDSPTRVEDKEMSQRPSQTQNREIPEQEGVKAEEGETDKAEYVMSGNGRRTRR
jgi:hypothetical protein